VAGGLDLLTSAPEADGDPPPPAQPNPTPEDTDDRPAWARPEAAKATSVEAVEMPTTGAEVAATQPTEVTATQPVAVPATPGAPPANAMGSTPPAPDFSPSPVPESDPSPVDTASAAPMATTDRWVIEPSVTADGHPLFATTPEAHTERDAAVIGDGPADHDRRVDRPPPLTSSLADMVEDTDELLRRIADLKGH
jgi:hypothetical protein